MNCELKLPAVAIFAATDGTRGRLFADIAASVTRLSCRCNYNGGDGANLHTVSGLWSVSAACVQAQFDARLQCCPRAFKVGVVAANVRVVAACLDVFPKTPVVWDPVISASAGGRVFADKKIRREMLRYLAPRVFVVTPNHSELRLLSGQDDLTAGVQTLFDAGVRHVLVTDAGGGRTVRHALFSASTVQNRTGLRRLTAGRINITVAAAFFLPHWRRAWHLKIDYPLPPSSPTKKRWRPCAQGVAGAGAAKVIARVIKYRLCAAF